MTDGLHTTLAFGPSF